MFDPAWEEGHKRHRWAAWPNTRFVEFAIRTFGTRVRDATRFLELGCGGGAQLAFLAEEGFVAEGLDAAPSAVAKAMALIADRGCAGFAVAAQRDITRAAFPLATFDCVYDVCTLQHLSLDEARTVIARAWGWLAAGGVFWSMMAREIDPLPADTPAPRICRDRDEVKALFHEGWTVEIGEETIRSGNGQTVRHWIVAAYPLNTAAKGKAT